MEVGEGITPEEPFCYSKGPAWSSAVHVDRNLAVCDNRPQRGLNELLGGHLPLEPS